MKICVIIPVYNEERMIGQIVEKIKALGFAVVVINDGSTDRGGSFAEQKGAIVIQHLQKQGKGVSLRDGFAYALGHGFDGVVAMDGDGQHAVEDIEKFVAKAKECPSCVISGNRMLDCQRMPWVRRLVNRLMSLMISALCGQFIPDSQCGFRFVSSDVLKAISLVSSDFEIETEVLIKASRKGFKIHHVPIQTIYRDETSKINPFVDTLRFFRYLAKELFSRSDR